MASVYLANVAGDGASPATAWRPSGFDGVSNRCLMIDSGAKKKCLVYSDDDTVIGTGVNQLLTAANRGALLTLAQTTNPTAGQRNAANTWLTNAGYSTLTGAQVTWFDCLRFIIRQVNPQGDLT